MEPILIAHRSGPTHYPEQTIASARYALDCGADMVEMDVQFTVDGHPVISHDSNTQRVFGEDALVSEISLQRFLAMRHVADSSYCSHSLDTVLRCGVKPLLLHLKVSGNSVRQVAEHVCQHGDPSATVLGVKYPDDAALVKQCSSALRTLAFMPTLAYYDAFLHTDVDAIRLWENWVTEDRIREIHESGHQVWIMAGQPTPEGVGYTAAESLLYWRELQVDGILVNDIPWAKHVLSALDK